MLNSREIITLLEADGWYLVHVKGSHHQFRHPTKPGKVTVKHPCKDWAPKTYRSMQRQSGLRF
jgi:predicted RNA binding protein YcfA (HicA-like mRNA interferase family)